MRLPVGEHRSAVETKPKPEISGRPIRLPHPQAILALSRHASACAQQAVDMLVFPIQRPLMIPKLALSARKLAEPCGRFSSVKNFL